MSERRQSVVVVGSKCGNRFKMNSIKSRFFFCFRVIFVVVFFLYKCERCTHRSDKTNTIYEYFVLILLCTRGLHSIYRAIHVVFSNTPLLLCIYKRKKTSRYYEIIIIMITAPHVIRLHFLVYNKKKFYIYYVFYKYTYKLR